MGHRKIVRSAALVLVLAWVAAGVALAQGTVTLERWLIAGGGDRATGGSIAVIGALGQGIGGPSSGGSASVCAGFWCGAASSSSRVYLPLTLRKFGVPGCDPYEPNDQPTAPWGPLASTQAYQAKLCSGDAEDNYYFETTTTNAVQLRLQLPGSLVNHTSMWLYHASNLSTAICGTGPVTSGDYQPTCNITQTGRHVIRMYTDGASDDANSYTLTATYQ